MASMMIVMGASMKASEIHAENVVMTLSNSATERMKIATDVSMKVS